MDSKHMVVVVVSPAACFLEQDMVAAVVSPGTYCLMTDSLVDFSLDSLMKAACFTFPFLSC